MTSETSPRLTSLSHDNESQALDLEDATLGIVADLDMPFVESFYFYLRGPDEHQPRHPCCYECTRFKGACGNLRLQGKRVLTVTHVADASFLSSNHPHWLLLTGTAPQLVLVDVRIFSQY